jgi:hypothetical protein
MCECCDRLSRPFTPSLQDDCGLAHFFRAFANAAGTVKATVPVGGTQAFDAYFGARLG